MREFINWCFDIDSPIPVFIIAIILSVILFAVYLLAIVAFFASGLWIIGIFMMLGAPVLFLIHQYGKRDE